MKIYYHPTKENSLFPNQLFDGNKELSHILTKDVDVILWEYNDSITDWQDYRQAQNYPANVALLIADYEKFRDDAHIQFYLRNANCVVVPTIAAKRDLILNYGFGGEKIFTDEFRDLPLSWHVDTDNRYSKKNTKHIGYNASGGCVYSKTTSSRGMGTADE